MKKILKIAILSRKNVKNVEYYCKKLLNKFDKYDKIIINLKGFEVDNLSDSSNFESTNEEVIFHISCQKHTEECEQNKGSQKRQERKTRVAKARDAANYLIRLYYYGHMNCTAAAVQKLLIIAQMRSLRRHGVPLFDSDLTVKPSCFSIKIISNTYPDIIFAEGDRTPLVDSYNGTNTLEIPVINNSLPELSSFYEIFEQLSQQEIELIEETYSQFGAFSGVCIGRYMQQLQLHIDKKQSSSTNVSRKELQEFVNGLSLDISNNPIVSFICG